MLKHLLLQPIPRTVKMRTQPVNIVCEHEMHAAIKPRPFAQVSVTLQLLAAPTKALMY